MSAYTEQVTQFKDASLLLAALQACGFPEGVQVHEIAQRLEGYHGDKRTDTAEIIIPRKYVGRASNDMGFKRQPDGTYKAIISEFDSSTYNAQWMCNLVDKYTELGIVAKARKAGLRYLGKSIVSGKMKLQFSKA